MARRTRFPYKAVALGGTFDSFHKGHEQLVSKAFELGQKVLIGITSDSFARKQKKSHPVQPFTSRVKTLRLFLRSKGWSSRARLVPLEDPYGPTVTMRDLEGLVITPDNAKNAAELNQLRIRKGLRPLTIHAIPLFMAADGRPISSTRIRRGEIDREGRLAGR